MFLLNLLMLGALARLSVVGDARPILPNVRRVRSSYPSDLAISLLSLRLFRILISQDTSLIKRVD